MKKITRAEYMANSSQLHEAYHEQFVTPAIKKMVLSRWSVEQLKTAYANNKYFNNLPLSQWDSLAGGYGSQLCADKLRAVGDSPSLASGVCILKAAARMIVREN